jgi:hypothetical protein
MSEFCAMWIIFLIFLFLILCWFFLAPLEIQIDTRIPAASVRWITIAKGAVLYEEDKWWLKMRVGFFHKQWDLEKLISSRKKKVKKSNSASKKKSPGGSRKLRKLLNVVRTFRVTSWQIALDTGDEPSNAWLYSLNFFPATRRHFHMNFNDENYVTITIRNVPWKLTYAFLK